ALGQELISRGATVRFVKLPEQGTAKVGLDDWLVAVGAEWKTLWPILERMRLDDERLTPVAAWWQRWREVKATQSAVKDRDMDAVELTESAGLYTVILATHGVRLLFDRLTDERGGVKAEVTVTLGATELLSGVDLGLKSDTGQTKLAGSLKALAATIPWK